MSDHDHAHGHGFDGGWDRWLADPVLRVVLAAVAGSVLAAVVALVVLWPTGEGRDAAIANADEIGFVTERLSATVDSVLDTACSYSTDENPQQCRTLTLTVHEGPEAGAIVSLPEINLRFDRSVPDLAPGDKVILGYEDSTNTYFYADRDRRGSLVWLTVLFAVVVVAFGRLRGLLALISMIATIGVLVAFVAPSVLDGNDPVLVAIVAAAVIATLSLYLTHGFTPTTTVALAGTLGALVLTLILSWIFFDLAAFTGLATEEAIVLPFIDANLDVAALLLGGAVIGALGALDDVTVTQVATVAELRRRNPELPTTDLVASGIRVGRDHIASTVNTLLLAYVGASTPLLLLFAVSDQPLEMVANSEIIAMEIVRTLCGSLGLVAAVPITTALAAAVLRPADEPIAAETDDDEGAAPEEPPPPAEPPRRAPRWEDFGPE